MEPVFARRSIRGLALATALVSSSFLLGAAGCKGEEEDVGAVTQPLSVVCVEPNEAPPAGAWICGEDRVVECDAHQGAHVDFIYATPAAPTCPGALDLSHPQPYFLPGEYVISVSVAGAPQELCASTLTVVDTAPPVITPKLVSLWSPNHKYHHITPADCLTIEDACDAKVDVWFTWASSDEPANDKGDGNTESDITNLGCGGVDLRSERQGGSDGRVYTLGWQAKDHAGHLVEGTCQVVVPHDQSGKPAVDSGEDHRVELADAEACDPTPVLDPDISE